MKIVLFIATLVLSTIWAEELITPIPENVRVHDKKAELGKALFHDTRLSKDDTISCATCHNLQEGGEDGLRFSFGVGGEQGAINTPTVFNAVFNFSQFWDGRAKDLNEQAVGPIHNPIEMASSLDEVLKKLQKDSKLVGDFEKIYQDGITKENIIDAIVEFEKSLVTPNSRFDKFLKGDKTALSKKEKRGYQLFKSHGCISCHNGINIGGNLYQKFGIIKGYNDSFDNKGRFNVTKDEEDKYFFKVPTLRNINKTAPYFHTGDVDSLEEAIQIMSALQLGKRLKDQEVEAIHSFLLTLDGETPQILKEEIE